MNKMTLMTGAVMGIMLLAIATSDYLIVERPRTADAGNESSSSESSSSESTMSESSFDMSQDASSSSRAPVPKGVQKSDGVNIEQILAENGYVVTTTDEQSLMAQVAGNTEMQAMTLLKDDDRAAYFAWIETPDVKNIFGLLKQTLAERFSGDVRDLVDETVRPPDGPPRDVLAFIDPALGEERFVFIRVKTRLYEFHVPNGKDELIAELIEKLAQ